MKQSNPFRGAPKCPRCKHYEYDHGDYGCLAPQGRRVCNCTKTLKELERDRLANPSGAVQHPRPPRPGARILRRAIGLDKPLTQDEQDHINWANDLLEDK
jgi:hypothetical protein